MGVGIGVKIAVITMTPVVEQVRTGTFSVPMVSRVPIVEGRGDV